MSFLSKLFVGVACPLDDRISKSPQLIFTLAAIVFLITPPLLAQATPLPSVWDATFSTLSRRGTPKDILRGGGKRHACLTKANYRQVNRHRLTR